MCLHAHIGFELDEARDLPKLMVSNEPELGHFLNEGVDGILMDLGMSSLQVIISGLECSSKN